jgi:hypothetical protein
MHFYADITVIIYSKNYKYLCRNIFIIAFVIL